MFLLFQRRILNLKVGQSFGAVEFLLAAQFQNPFGGLALFPGATPPPYYSSDAFWGIGLALGLYEAGLPRRPALRGFRPFEALGFGGRGGRGQSVPAAEGQGLGF